MSSPAVAEPAATAAAAATAARVLVVEANDLLRTGLRVVLGGDPRIAGCAGARGVEEALVQVRRVRPDVVLVGASVLHEFDLVVGGQIRAAHAAARVVLLTEAGGVAVRAARAAGACGTVSLEAPTALLAEVVVTVAAGRTSFAATTRASAATSTLSGREREVLRLVSSGATNVEIARELFLSPHTIKQHTRSLYKKLGVRNRTEAAQSARANGLVA